MKKIYSLIVILILMLAITGCNDIELTPVLSFDDDKVTINVEEEYSLKYSYENIEEPVFEFSLSIDDIVSIDSLGKIKGLSEGEVVITILETTTNLTDTIYIEVLEILVPTVSFLEEDIEIELNEEILLAYNYENVDLSEIKFYSANADIVSIDSLGNIKGLKSGNVIITILIENTDINDAIEVTVLEPLLSGPIYNINTNEELEYALTHYKDGDSFIINGVVEADDLILNNVDLVINNILTVNKFMSLQNVRILDSLGTLSYLNDIEVKGSLEVKSINLINNNIKLSTNSNLVIREEGVLGSVILDEGTNNITINNYGSLFNIDLSKSAALDSKKIIINNYGILRDLYNAIIINETISPENTLIKSLGSYFWIEDSIKYTNWDILEVGPRYVFKTKDNESLEIFLNNKSGDLAKVVNDYVSLYDVVSLETNILIKTEYRSLSVNDFEFLSTINGLNSLNIYNTTVSKNMIPDGAFKDVTSLTYIDLPKGLVSIASQAFAGTNITDVFLPESLTTVANDAFGDYSLGDYKLEEVHLDSINPKGETFIRGFSPKTLFFVPEVAVNDYVNEWLGFSAVVEYGFYYYGTYVFPEAFFYEDYYLRNYEEGLEIVLYNKDIKENLIPSEFTIDDVVKPVVSIGNNAFRFVKNESDLAIDITIPDSIIRIGDRAFFEFKTIKSLDLNNVKHIGIGAFNLISYEFTTITSPNLEYISDDAFNGLTKVTSLDLENVIYLGERSLQNCQGLTEVYAPKLKYLGTSSLSSCTKLQKITLGPVENCGSWTISGSNSIQEVDFTHSEDEYIEPAFGSGWTQIDKSSVTIYCNIEVLEYFEIYFPLANVLVK
ncbi:MAG: leucine-rich repeat protein [Bacilli bacterium]